MPFSSELLTKYPITSDQVNAADIRLVLDSLQRVVEGKVPGAVVEFGCYVGTTSLFIRRLLDKLHASDRYPFHTYDSFEGLPQKTFEDESTIGRGFRAGVLQTSKKQFIREFQRSSLRPPIVHKGWFENLTATDVPQPIAFAFLDGDFYGSIYSALKLIWPWLSKGSVVLIHDYGREALPGVERAVDDFFRDKPMPPLKVVHNIAILQS